MLIAFRADPNEGLVEEHRVPLAADAWGLAVTENLQTAVVTSAWTHTVTAVEHPGADRAAAYGLEKIVIDGNDADEVYKTASQYMRRARQGVMSCATRVPMRPKPTSPMVWPGKPSDTRLPT